MLHLHHVSTLSIAIGLTIVLMSALGLLTGTWLVAGVGLAVAGVAKALVLSVWNGLTT